MPTYRKKPVEVQATQWFKNGDHPEDGTEVFKSGEFKGELLEGKVVRYYQGPNVDIHSICGQCGGVIDAHGWVDTLERGYRVCPGDFVITDVNGGHYPYKPRIFALKYEKV